MLLQGELVDVDVSVRNYLAQPVRVFLVDHRIPRRVDLDALDLFLTFRFVPSPLTMFARIRKLAPGHRLIKDERGCRVQRYFSAGVATHVDLSEREWIALLQERLEAAVQTALADQVAYLESLVLRLEIMEAPSRSSSNTPAAPSSNH